LTQAPYQPIVLAKLEFEETMKRSSWLSIILINSIAFGFSAIASAQQVDHYTPDVLMNQAKELQQKAATTNGSASETLEKYGVDYTMLAVRSKDGTPELHEKFADIFVIVDGSATLLTGGEMQGPSTISPGELHGISILHGTSTSLNKGDVVHIPANTPHQLLVPKGTLTYFVVKVKEKD
jgi:mannose-6-phosphate isomerase-like protein (cupin superfamily)